MNLGLVTFFLLLYLGGPRNGAGPLRVGETGGSKGMGGIREGDHPSCTSCARKFGDTRICRCANAHGPFPARGVETLSPLTKARRDHAPKIREAARRPRP